jgi:hypothetical protein
MEKMTKSQLQEICDKKGITYTSKDTKKDLIERIHSSKTTSVEGKSYKDEY